MSKVQPGALRALLGQRRYKRGSYGSSFSAHHEGEYEDALQVVDEIEYQVSSEHNTGIESDDDLLLYEPKPLYTVADEKKHGGSLIFRDWMQTSMWGVPNRFRNFKGFVQRGRLHEMKMMLHRVYDTDFASMSATEYDSTMFGFRSEPMIRPRIPSLLNPQFARAVLNYMLKQMKALGMKRLIMYELSGMNGQTALNILDILEEEHPELYRSCEYHMIDVAGIWMTHRHIYVKKPHYNHYFEHHISIFDWEVVVPERNFFLCLEILSHFPQDRVVATGAGGLTDVNKQGAGMYLYETFVQEDADFDDRSGTEYRRPIKYSRYDTQWWFRPLQDELIKEYFRHVDFDGNVTHAMVQQTQHDLIDMEKYDRSTAHPQPNKKLDSYSVGIFAADSMYASAHILGLLNNVFYVPTLQVSLCDKLRRYFPRHTLIVLEQFGQNTCLDGVNPPICRAYLHGQAIDIKSLKFSEDHVGVTELREQFSFSRFRELYYKMMGLDPAHPLHLKVQKLHDFFEQHGTDEMRKELTVPDTEMQQPLHAFRGARLMTAEFGSDLAQISDSPADAALDEGHWRHRVYNRVCHWLERIGFIEKDSLWNLKQIDTEVNHDQIVDNSAVLNALGPNPSPEALDVPVGWYTRKTEAAARKAARIAKLEENKKAESQKLE